MRLFVSFTDDIYYLFDRSILIVLTDNSSLILHIIVADNDIGSITYYVPVIFNDNIET